MFYTLKLAKKNERVQRDLEEQTNQLNELKMELHRLESSAVRPSPPYATRRAHSAC